MADILIEAAGSFTNPMRDDDDDADASAVGLSKHQERRLREDSNAVICPDYFARARKLLFDSETGDPTALARALEPAIRRLW